MDISEKIIRDALGDDLVSFDYRTAGTARKGWRKYILDGPENRNTEARHLVHAKWRALHEKDIRVFVGKCAYRIGPNAYADPWGDDPRNGPPYRHEFGPQPPICSQIFIMPGLPVLDIVEFAKVGNHNANPALSVEMFEQFWNSQKDRLSSIYGPENADRLEQAKDQMRQGFASASGPDRWVSVKNSLAEIMNVAPFAIQAANEAEFEARFIKPVDARQAKIIATLLLEEPTGAEVVDTGVARLEDLGLPIPMDKNSPYNLPDYEAAWVEYLMKAGEFGLWWD